MASVNKVILIGYLGRDPEMRRSPTGKVFAIVSLATSERWNNEEHTEWHRIIFWDRLAEVAKEYLRRGSQVYIEGKIHYRSWDDHSGVKRYSTEINAQSMMMLSSKGGGGSVGYVSSLPDPEPEPEPEPNPEPMANHSAQPAELAPKPEPAANHSAQPAELATKPEPAPNHSAQPAELAPKPEVASTPSSSPATPSAAAADVVAAADSYPPVGQDSLPDDGDLPF
jgi:single-strand DNA-binding protein